MFGRLMRSPGFSKQLSLTHVKQNHQCVQGLEIFTSAVCVLVYMGYWGRSGDHWLIARFTPEKL